MTRSFSEMRNRDDDDDDDDDDDGDNGLNFEQPL